jgi:hypothetical protein
VRAFQIVLRHGIRLAELTARREQHVGLPIQTGDGLQIRVVVDTVDARLLSRTQRKFARAFDLVAGAVQVLALALEDVLQPRLTDHDEPEVALCFVMLFGDAGKSVSRVSE